jgi:hypothetical protein
LRQKTKNGTICAAFCPFLSIICGPRRSEVPYFKLSIVDQQRTVWWSRNYLIFDLSA